MSFPGGAAAGRPSGLTPFHESSSPSKSPLLKPDSFCKIEKIGHGAWGEVTKCEMMSKGKPTGRFFAVKKTLPAEMTEDPLPIPMELQNLETLYALGGHANIVQYNGYFLQKGTEYIHFVFELATGGNVAAFLNEKGRVSEKETAIITRGLLSGLYFLHSNGIVHRDLKLDNLMLKDRASLEVKIIDFASARKVDENGAGVSKALAIRHTAPESISGSPTVYNQASEIFAAGILVFELLTGSHPFGRRYDSLLLVLGLGPLRAVCRRRIRQYRLDIDNEAFQAVSEEGKSFILRLLAHSPEARPNAQDALEDTWLRIPVDSFIIERSDS